MDKLAAGRLMERAVAAYMRDHLGWEDTWSPPRAKYSSQDIFGVWDIVAIRQDGVIVLAQVCERHAVGRHKDDISTWMPRWWVQARLQLWLYDEHWMRVEEHACRTETGVPLEERWVPWLRVPVADVLASAGQSRMR